MSVRKKDLRFPVSMLILQSMKTLDAIQHFGSRDVLARVLDIDLSAISHWGEYVPLTRQYQLQVITAGKLVAKPVQKAGETDAVKSA